MMLVMCLAMMPAVFGAVDPKDAQSLSDANKAYNEGKYAQSAQLLEELTRRQPTFAEAYRMLGHAYYMLNRLDEARAAYLSALSQGRITTDLVARLVQIDQSSDRQAAVNAEASLLALLEPNDRQWQTLQADQLLRGGAAAEALTIYQSLQKGHAADAALWLRVANAHLRMEQHRQAALAFEMAWRLGDRTAAVARTLADLHARAEDPLAAAAWYAQAADLAPADAPTLLLRRAQALLTAGRNAEAQSVAKALTTAADSTIAARAHLMLGRIAYDARRSDQAAEHWAKAVAAGHDDSTLRSFIGSTAFNAGDYAKAVEHLLPLTQGPEPEPDHLRYAAEALMRSSRHAEARPLVLRYLELFGYDDKAATLVRSLAAATPTP
jgi:Flp pilus assembly protein TadD